MTFVTAGSDTVFATDASDSGITTSAAVLVSPAKSEPLHTCAPGSSAAGSAFTVTLTAFDPFGNIATGYTGTAHFTKSDGGLGSSVPLNYTFVGGDAGVHVFTNGVTFVTAASDTVTATDTGDRSITATATVAVVCGSQTSISRGSRIFDCGSRLHRHADGARRIQQCCDGLCRDRSLHEGDGRPGATRFRRITRSAPVTRACTRSRME